MPIVNIIKGSILDAPQSHIAHGVNCQNKMGSGVAKVLFNKYPEVKEQYHELFKEFESLFINGREDMLGKVQQVKCSDKVILNCFTQEYFGYDGKLYVSYDAIKKCFSAINNSGITELAIPKIGCGLAGGDWDLVRFIIDQYTSNVKVYVYEL